MARISNRRDGNLRIAIDMDDTLADVVSTLFRRYRLPPPHVWLFEKEYGIRLERFMRDLRTMWVKRWGMIPPTEGGLSASVGKLIGAGNVVDIVTVDFVEQKRKWLGLHGIPFRDVISVRRGEDKAGLDYDVFVDDSPVNHAAFAEAGKASVVYERKWNHDVRARPRIRSMSEAADAIAGACRQ